MTITGKFETLADKIRAILAQKEFCHTIRSFSKKGVPFDKYVYVPEKHPTTGMPFHDREDVGHLLKVRNVLSVNAYIVCHIQPYSAFVAPDHRE
jgi:hypothetical protein